MFLVYLNLGIFKFNKLNFYNIFINEKDNKG